MPRAASAKPKNEDEQAPPAEPVETAADKADEEPTLEAYEQNRLDLIARLDTEIERRKGVPETIVGKLAMITGLIGQVKKTGRNTFYNYRYAKESDLVEAIRPLLARLGIWVWWSLYANPEKGIVHHERRSQVVKDKDKNVVGEQETLTVVTAQFKFIQEDGKETEPQIMMGYGDDNSDKGLYKALTGMEKYFLFKTFLVSTGDDPEGDKSTDERAASRGASTRVDVQRSGQTERTAQPRHGGRQQDSSSTQVKVLGELLRATGRKKSVDVLSYLGVEVPEGKEPAEVMTEALAKMEPQKMGEIIAKLRAEVQSSSNVEADVASATEPNREAGPAPDDAGWVDPTAKTPDQVPEQAEQGGGNAPETTDDEPEDAGPIA